MANCPNCQSPLEEDFGLVNCSNCGASVFLNMEEEPMANEAVEVLSESPAVAETPAEELSSYLVDEVSRSVKAEEIAAFESAEEAESFHVEAQQQHFEPLVEPFSEPVPAAMGEDLTEVVDTGEEASVASTPLPEMPAGPPVQENGDLSDIAHFGNSEVSLGREGSLRFNIFISGVDTAEIRQELKEVMMDSKFLWSEDEILKAVTEGRLKIPGVSSVKAALFIQRVKHLPIGVTWEQYDIHQA